MRDKINWLVQSGAHLLPLAECRHLVRAAFAENIYLRSMYDFSEIRNAKLSMKISDSSSISIREAGEVRGQSDGIMYLLSDIGDGDDRIRVWELPWGARVIETSGDSLFEGEAH